MLICYDCKNHRDFFQVSKNQLFEKQKRTLTVSQEHGKASIVKGKWDSFTGRLAVGIYCSVCNRAVKVEREDAAYLDDKPFSLLQPEEFKARQVLRKIKSLFPDANIYIHEVAPKKAVPGNRLLKLTAPIIKSLERQGLSNEKLYSHQTDAIHAVLNGKNIIVSTPAASGKTLCFNIPVLNSIVQDKNSRALYIYPTKALAQDQILKIAGFRDDFPRNEQLYRSGYHFTMKVGGCSIVFGKYEGPTPDYYKRMIRGFCNIVLTNPDMLHLAILRHNHLWTSFLKNLNYIVLDEVHVYKGIFGSNVSLVLRRLRKLCDTLGASPQFILCSATIPNPLGHARALTGCPNFTSIENDGAPQSERTFILWNPPFIEPKKAERVEPTTNSVDLLTKVLLVNEKPIRTVVFGRSRSSVKGIFRLTKARLVEKNMDHLSDLIREYTATLLPERREEISNELVDGRISTIIATNALELGIDIGDLSCCVSAGYPGTIASVYQQAGRVGRVGEGLCITILQNEPLEQFYARNPNEFFSKPVEEVRVNPCNEFLLQAHLACAAWEAQNFDGISDQDFEKFFGIEAEKCKKLLADQKTIYSKIRNNVVYWRFSQGAKDPYHPIRNPISKNNFVIKCNGREVGVMDSATVLRDLHPGAIWTDQDEQYEVVDLDFDKYEATVRKVDVDYYTFSMPVDNVRIASQKSQLKKAKGFDLVFGCIEIERRVFSYQKVKYGRGGKETAESMKVEGFLPAQVFPTESFWLIVPSELLDKVAKTIKSDNPEEVKERLSGGLHAIEHALVAMLPRIVDCDPNDVGGLSSLTHKATEGKATIFVYDNFAGGVGLAQACYEKFDTLVEHCIKLMEGCRCHDKDGCPSCIQTSRCGTGNKPLDKRVALALLKELRKE